MKKTAWITMMLVGVVVAGGLRLASASECDCKRMKMKKHMMAKGMNGAAIDGFCPVCIHKGMMAEGSPKFATEYKGKVYYFASFKSQKAFINDPEKYIADLEKRYEALKSKAMEGYKGSGMEKGSH